MTRSRKKARGSKTPGGFWDQSPPPALKVRIPASAWSRSLAFLRKLVGLGRKKD